MPRNPVCESKMTFVITLVAVYFTLVVKPGIMESGLFTLNLNLKVKGNQRQTIWILVKVFCIFRPNLVILTWMGDELSHGQSSVFTHTQATTKLASGKTHTEYCFTESYRCYTRIALDDSLERYGPSQDLVWCSVSVLTYA